MLNYQIYPQIFLVEKSARTAIHVDVAKRAALSSKWIIDLFFN